jgi:N-acetylglucosamine kinase-like BadF-type ATPase
LHIGRNGVRGPAAFDLTVSHDIAGTLAGSFPLTDAQVAALGAGSIYVQIHSEKAPDGNLWGWLLEPAVRK